MKNIKLVVLTEISDENFQKLVTVLKELCDIVNIYEDNRTILLKTPMDVVQLHLTVFINSKFLIDESGFGISFEEIYETELLLDEILDKISMNGLKSLTESELNKLKFYSENEIL